MTEQLGVLSNWWIRRMVGVRQPVHEKLTLLWHNHFATSAQKVRVAGTWPRRIRNCATCAG